MKRALIGHTGFVGSTLKRDESFSHLFNSGNFNEMREQRFDEVVCAGIAAVKWKANKEPELDWQGIQALLDVLAEVDAERFTLISTVDVYPDPSQPLDERFDIPAEAGQPYGRHRLAAERFVQEHFAQTLVVRLPALFGRGLKKNVIFDLLTANQTDKINLAGVFQWYPLSRLSADIARAREAGLSLANLFPEPVPTERIIAELFPGAVVGAAVQPAPYYRLGTAHAEVFGGQGRSIMDADAVLAELSAFVDRARRDPAGELGA
jgi:hypothetical protein